MKLGINKAILSPRQRVKGKRIRTKGTGRTDPRPAKPSTVRPSRGATEGGG